MKRDRTVITRHINNIFNEEELDFESNEHFLHTERWTAPNNCTASSPNSKINIFSAKKWRKKNVCGHARYIPAAFHTLHSLPHWEWARGKIVLLKLQIFDYH
jgi:hypothetical protein